MINPIYFVIVKPKEGRRRGPFKSVRQKCTVLGYDVNNTKERIAGDSVRENQRADMGVGEVGARQDFGDGLMTGRAII